MPELSAPLDLAAGIVSAFISHNNVRAAELPDLIASVHAALAKIGSPPLVEEPAPELKPAVPIKKSITPEYLISLEDGKQYKALKRHLGSRGLTPDAYRAKWGLPSDYPMVAPALTARRSEMLRILLLGKRQQVKSELRSDTSLTSLKPGMATENFVADQHAPDRPASEEKVIKKKGRPKKVRAVESGEKAREDG